MKTLKFLTSLLGCSVLILSTSCSSDDSASNTNDPAPIINAVRSGNWRITRLEDSGVNETNQYASYVFNFGNSNALTATGNNTYNGFWSVMNDDDSNDDSPSNDLDFVILFSSPAPADFIDDLSDDWDILSYSATKIELIDVSGGNGGTDYLTFEKI